LDKRDSFYRRVEKEVEELDNVQPQVHQPAVAKLSEDEAKKHWKKQAEQDRFLIMQNSL